MTPSRGRVPGSDPNEGQRPRGPVADRPARVKERFWQGFRTLTGPRVFLIRLFGASPGSEKFSKHGIEGGDGPACSSFFLVEGESRAALWRADRNGCRSGSGIGRVLDLSVAVANGIESHVVDAASIAVPASCLRGRGPSDEPWAEAPAGWRRASLRRPSVNATLNLKDARTIHPPIGALKNSRMTRGGAPSRNGRGSIVCERRAVMQTASREPKASAEKNASAPPAARGRAPDRPRD